MPIDRWLGGVDKSNPDLKLVEGDGDPPDFWFEDADGNKIFQLGQDLVSSIFGDLVDSPNSNTVYDQSTQEVKADVNNTTTSTDELILTPVDDFTSAFNGGQTKGAAIPNASLGESYIVKATPENDPGNEHGYTTDSIRWNDSAQAMQYDVTETENAGGGTARIRVFQIKVP